MQDKAGILLIASGHPYYARMAVNLAVSIKWHSKDIPVCLAWNGEGFPMLTDQQKAVFDKTVKIPDSVTDGDPYRAKLHLDKLTPFDKTLYLDVDTIISPTADFAGFVASLDGIGFTMANRGRVGKSGSLKSNWIKLKDLEQAYGISEVYDLSSEVIYFEGKSKVFSSARKVYKEAKVAVSTFGSGYPDEVYFMIAIEKEGIELHASPFEPSYWEPRWFPKQHNREHIQGYPIMSVGGAFTTAHIEKIYNSFLRHYYNSTGNGLTPFQLVPKHRVKELKRQKI